jgi:hypothetical protein
MKVMTSKIILMIRYLIKLLILWKLWQVK